MRTCLILVCLTCGFVCQALAEPTVTFHETSIILRDGRARYVLPDLIDPHTFHETLHAVARRGRDYFIVYGSSEMSRGWPPRGGRCGSGIESFIRWLHVRDGKVIKQQEGLYESCWRDRYDSLIEWKDGKLQWQTDGFKHVGTETAPKPVYVVLKWVFDPAHPELGITESDTPSAYQLSQ